MEENTAFRAGKDCTLPTESVWKAVLLATFPTQVQAFAKSASPTAVLALDTPTCNVCPATIAIWF